MVSWSASGLALPYILESDWVNYTRGYIERGCMGTGSCRNLYISETVSVACEAGGAIDVKSLLRAKSL